VIGRLAGRLDHVASDHVLLDVGGVGYVVHISERTRAALPGVGQAVALYTELLVREDLLQLFGFLSLQEKEWHRLLISVQGIGAKASMAILGTLGPDGVSRALAIGDWASIKAAPGVGPKIAQRVVNELREKAPAVMALSAGAPPLEPPSGSAGSGDALVETAPPPAPGPAAPVASGAGGGAQAPTMAQAQAEALSALTNLGYGPSDAARAVAEATETEAETAGLIRAALRLLAPKG
jgi:Holliday junction DNA helicase RuvA